MISKEEAKHIANLARLGLTAKEIEKFQKELSATLDYFEKLKEVDVSKTEPTSHPLAVENVTRRDEERKADPKLREKLISQTPEIKEGYLKVKSIL